MSFFKRQKLKKETKAAIRKARRELAKQNAKNEIREATDAMLEKPCPFRGLNNCFSGCVHFKKGFVFYLDTFSHFSGDWFKSYPKCKLWGDK